MIYFTADNHFFHQLAAGHRGFDTSEEMDAFLIKEWNTVVNEKDEVYILGDFAFDRHGTKINSLLCKLKGKKSLVKGNHDHWAKEKILPNIQELFEEVSRYKELKYKKRKLILFHYPLIDWNFKKFGSIHLHGHQHTNQYGVQNMLNVSVDLHGYRPISIEDVLRIVDSNQNEEETENLV